MRRFLSCISIPVLAAGCHRSMPEEVDPYAGDLDQNHIQDVDQSIGVGHDDRGEPVIFFFPGPWLPAYTSALGYIGFGCSLYDNDPTDDWLKMCKPFDQKVVNGKVVAYLFTGIREGVHEGVPFDPTHGLYANLEDLETTGDEAGIVVKHVDGPNCPVDQQRVAFHYGFIRVGDDIDPLYDSVAPPDPSCH